MNAIFRWFDVDRVQWRALVHRTLQIDFAMVTRAQKRSRKVESGIFGIILFSLLIYSFAGISPAMIAYQSSDPLLGASLLSTMVGFMVVSTLLVGEGATIVSPNDHHILGFRPVTSRTYLAVRVTTILLRTLFISTCVAFLTVLVFLFKGGRELHLAMAAAALITAWVTGIGMTLAVVGMYGWLLRLAGPQRMLRWASYLQFSVQMLTWIVFVLVTQDIAKRALAGFTISGTPWVLVYPGAWFGSYVQLAAGDVSLTNIVAAILSLSLVAALARTITGKLSLDYAENLGGLASAAAPRPVASSTPAWLRLLNHESRAVSILVRSHLKHDTRFRLGLISLLPITLIYMVMGGKPPDPFVSSSKGEVMVIQMALFFLPLTLRRVLVTSEAWRAAWVFVVTPADRARLVMSARNLIMLFFLAPYLLFLWAIFAWSFGHWWHAALHTLFTGMISFLVLQFMVMIGPQLPFSLPHDKESRGAMMFGLMMFAAVAGFGLYFFLRYVVYESAFRMVAAAVAFVALGWVMDRVTRRRARALLIEG